MIQVNFKFEVRIMPLLAIEIERNINGEMQKDGLFDHSIDAIIEIEYRGSGLVSLHLPLHLPLDYINRSIQIIFNEFKERNLLPD